MALAAMGFEETVQPERCHSTRESGDPDVMEQYVPDLVQVGLLWLTFLSWRMAVRG